MTEEIERVIYKYPLELRDTQVINLHKNAQILTVQLQSTNMQLWALTNPEEEREPRTIAIIGTGCIVPYPNLKYISTVQTLAGYVWHVFEVVDLSPAKGGEDQ